jgi:hypothetical protein
MGMGGNGDAVSPRSYPTERREGRRETAAERRLSTVGRRPSASSRNKGKGLGSLEWATPTALGTREVPIGWMVLGVARHGRWWGQRRQRAPVAVVVARWSRCGGGEW